MTTPEIPERVQRWTAKRRVALVVSLLKGETSAAEAARQHGLTVAEVEDWRDKFLRAAEDAVRGRPHGVCRYPARAEILRIPRLSFAAFSVSLR